MVFFKIHQQDGWYTYEFKNVSIIFNREKLKWELAQKDNKKTGVGRADCWHSRKAYLVSVLWMPVP